MCVQVDEPNFAQGLLHKGAQAVRLPLVVAARVGAVVTHDPQARRYREAQERRSEEANCKTLERNRWRRLCELAVQAREADRVRAVLMQLQASDLAPAQEVAGRSLVDWFAWAHEMLKRQDPLRCGPACLHDDGNRGLGLDWVCGSGVGRGSVCPR